MANHRVHHFGTPSVDSIISSENARCHVRVPVDERLKSDTKHVLRILRHGWQKDSNGRLGLLVANGDALRDVHRLVAHSLKIGDETKSARKKAKVLGHRLTEREDPKDQLVDIDLVAVDLGVHVANLVDHGEFAIPVGLEGESYGPLAASPHCERVGTQLPELGLEISASVRRLRSMQWTTTFLPIPLASHGAGGGAQEEICPQ